LTFLLGTLMVAGVLAGASTSTTTKKGTIGTTLHGVPGAPLCPSCTGGGNNGGK
jgi:uncharacterized membrane protein YeaQ/YmgE (transglycosylase-associated protein family)